MTEKVTNRRSGWPERALPAHEAFLMGVRLPRRPPSITASNASLASTGLATRTRSARSSPGNPCGLRRPEPPRWLWS